MFTLKVQGKLGQALLQVDRSPDSCPICHHAIEPKPQNTDVLVTDVLIERVFQCPRLQCSRLFIARYEHRGPQFFLVGSVPTVPVPPNLPSEVASLSPVFASTYTQAIAADSQQLDELAGVGYRRALEFLVKDFCIHQNPAVADAIKKEALGLVIATRVDDPNVKECAKRAAWLGNDETHYVRKWGDKDIQDLKTLLGLTIAWIHSALLTKKYLESMSDPKQV